MAKRTFKFCVITFEDLLSTSKWPSEPQFCERWTYIWQKNGQEWLYIGLWVFWNIAKITSLQTMTKNFGSLKFSNTLGPKLPKSRQRKIKSIMKLNTLFFRFFRLMPCLNDLNKRNLVELIYAEKPINTLQMFTDKGLINYYFCMLLLHMKMCKLFKGY